MGTAKKMVVTRVSVVAGLRRKLVVKKMVMLTVMGW